MNILSYNPSHDGAIAYLKDGKLEFSIEAEKNSAYRYSPISSNDVFNILAQVEEIPDIICVGGWWPLHDHALGSYLHVGYRGVDSSGIVAIDKRFLGKDVKYFSSSHERSHLLCAFGLSDLPKGTRCYALIWEGEIGAFYELDEKLNITCLANVMSEPGNRYASIYGLADPTFPKDAPFSRFSDAGKLMALASFSNRQKATAEEQKLIDFLINSKHVQLSSYRDLQQSPYYNVGLDDAEFRNFAGILSDKIFDAFYQFAKANLRKGLPLIIAGGCGLNCDWNTNWRQSKLFSDVFIPPVANDSGSAIGTAIDAQLYFTGDPKIEWSVYAGTYFDDTGAIDYDTFDIFEANYDLIADLLVNDLIIAWVEGKYEMGPRALGHRSILAAPFEESTRIRLNEIKQREQFRPIAPVCLEEDAKVWFGCCQSSPHMLFTYKAKTTKLRAVTHVNGTARLQTVSIHDNKGLYALLTAFKQQTGYGVLCNTSLNFNGRGFINNRKDLAKYVINHNLDGFVISGRVYLVRSSPFYQAYIKKSRDRKSKTRSVY